MLAHRSSILIASALLRTALPCIPPLLNKVNAGVPAHTRLGTDLGITKTKYRSAHGHAVSAMIVGRKQMDRYAEHEETPEEEA